MHDHNGHRQRVKERFLAEGLANFDAVHALEMLLFFVIHRRDTKPLARRLLDEFGSFSRVLSAPYKALSEVEGIGPSAAIYLNMIGQAIHYTMTEQGHEGRSFKSRGELARFIQNYFIGLPNEVLYLLCMDARGRLITVRKLGEGTVVGLELHPRVAVEAAITANAASVILAHNHPGGVAKFSNEDIESTRALAEHLRRLQIHLADHYVVGEDSCVSMVEMGGYTPQA